MTQSVPGLLQQNLVPGVGNNSLLFPNVTLPQGVQSFVRIQNIRVLAPSVSSTLLPQQVFEVLSTNPTGTNVQPFAITNPQQLVGLVQPGLVFSTSTSAVSFPQCISVDVTKLTKPAFTMTFTEGFASSFKTQDQEAGVIPPVAPTITGIGAVTVPPGTATNATRLIANFNNIPAGVNIFVSQTQLATSTSTLTASLVGATGTAATSIDGISYFPVTITSGSGSAIWDVTGSNLGGLPETANFGALVGFTANPSSGLPGLTGSTPGTVAGLLGPTSDVVTASTSAPIPRFVANQSNGSVTLSIVPCVTNLLFPFVTNAAGFDTGIALVNTSLDNAGSKQPFNTNSQHGTCTVFYFNGTTTAPTPQITADVPAGGMTAFTLQGGGVAGSTSSAAGFQGYIIARCNFQYAHGFAFISDRNTPSLGSQGYLALVIPDRGGSRPPDPFTTAGSGSGEMLVQ